ncbi:MAG: isocitrate lyase/PEP mutase family protein [Noviherbaspirillum sp.]|nr:isocitrate lyase/PEP mutase family protein [Noviherbaspirillum sp.]
MTNDHAGVGRKRLKFREILGRKSLTVMPGGFSPLNARMAQMAGYECFFVAGSQLAAFLYGLPDNGVIGLRDLVDHARHVAARADIPVLIDADTGFGNAVNVYYAVQECIRSGVAALQIEDQEAPKKSGTLAGRRCIPIDEAVGKYRAAVAARDELDPDFVICARCDVLGAEGGTFDEALERSVRYVTEAGADFIWLNSVQTREDLKRACKEIPAPVLTIWGGEGPAPTPAEYEQLGVRIALYPSITTATAMQATWELLNDFRERGPAALVDRVQIAKANPWGLVDRRQLIENDKVREIEEKYLPEARQRDYDKTWGHRESFGARARDLPDAPTENGS